MSEFSYRPYAEVALNTRKNGGCTFTAEMEVIEPESGYVVSTFPLLSEVYSDCTLGSRIASLVLRFRMRNGTFASASGCYLGTWLDGNTLHLDVVAIVDTLDDALELARKHKQIAVHDLANGCDISVLKEVV